MASSMPGTPPPHAPSQRLVCCLLPLPFLWVPSPCVMAPAHPLPVPFVLPLPSYDPFRYPWWEATVFVRKFAIKACSLLR